MMSIEKLLAILPIPVLERLACPEKVGKNNQIKLPGVALFVCLFNRIFNHSFVTQRLLAETYQNYKGQTSEQTSDHSSFGKRLAQINLSCFEAIFRRLYDELAPRITLAEQNAPLEAD